MEAVDKSLPKKIYSETKNNWIIVICLTSTSHTIESIAKKHVQKEQRHLKCQNQQHARP